MSLTVDDFQPESKNFDEITRRQGELNIYLSKLSERDSQVAFYFLMGAVSFICSNISKANQMILLNMMQVSTSELRKLIEMDDKTQ